MMHLVLARDAGRGSRPDESLIFIVSGRVLLGFVLGSIRAPFWEPESSLVQLSVLEGLRTSKQGAHMRGYSRRGLKSSDRGSTGGGTLNFGLTGARLPPPAPSPSTEKEGKRVDVYTRKYALESIH